MCICPSRSPGELLKELSVAANSFHLQLPSLTSTLRNGGGVREQASIRKHVCRMRTPAGIKSGGQLHVKHSASWLLAAFTASPLLFPFVRQLV